MPGAALLRSASAQAQRHGSPQVKGASKACGLTAQEKRGGTSCVNTPRHCRPSPRLGGQGSQAVDWCEDVLEALMVEGQQHPEPGSLAPSPLPCPHRRLISPSRVQEATCLANSRAESIEGPGPWRELSAKQDAQALGRQCLGVGAPLVRQGRGIGSRVLAKCPETPPSPIQKYKLNYFYK